MARERPTMGESGRQAWGATCEEGGRRRRRGEGGRKEGGGGKEIEEGGPLCGCASRGRDWRKGTTSFERAPSPGPRVRVRSGSRSNRTLARAAAPLALSTGTRKDKLRYDGGRCARQNSGHARRPASQAAGPDICTAAILTPCEHPNAVSYEIDSLRLLLVPDTPSESPRRAR